MKNILKWMSAMLVVTALISCGSQQAQQDSEFGDEAVESGDGGEFAQADESTGGDEFAVEGEEQKTSDKQDSLSEEDPFATEVAEEPKKEEKLIEQAQQQDELSLDEPAAPAEQAQTPPPEIQEPAVPEIAPEPTPEPVQTPAPIVDNTQHRVNITGIKFKGNDNGGTVLIEADGPLAYTSRRNPELKQFIIEIPNSNLPPRLQRPLNTRDMQGIVGAIDPYQNKGSSTSRIVLQLRDGASEPAVQEEGNTLLIVASGQLATPAETVPQVTDAGGNVDLNSTHILSSKSLSEYLSGNTKFFGKKISIEMNTMDVRDALRFITEESGVNMIIADDVKGNISLKLRQVPWDQALVMVMKTRGLGYSRQGNVLRITTLDALKKEEDDATALAKARRGVEPLKVRMYQISYADIPELEKKVAGFLSERGKAVGDVRTSSLVVTDIEDNLERVAKLLTSLDTQPQQVLIESKIVEAKEAFTRTLGVNWSLTPQAINVGNGSIRPGFASQPMDLSGGMFSFNLGVGVLDVLGTLNSTLALSEQEEKVKVISSPRILTLSNESASINQTTEVPVKSVSNQNGISTTSFSFKPLSLKLDVMPQITSDSSIIMKVGVKREFRGATIDPVNGSFSVNSREANTKVLVRNGQTAVIGGIYQSDATEDEKGVPYLRDLPFVGGLFRGRTSTKDKSELLIFLTPRILARTDLGGSSPSMSRATDVGIEGDGNVEAK